MKKYFLSFFLSAALLAYSAASHAQESKIITLKDGSVLSGKIVRFENGTYTLTTPNLGSLDIRETDILSIASPEGQTSPNQISAQNGSDQDSPLINKAHQLQKSIMADPELLADIQQLMSDPQLLSILSDPKLMSDIVGGDPQKIQQNEQIHMLMQNPKMMDFINKIQIKTPSQ